MYSLSTCQEVTQDGAMSYATIQVTSRHPSRHTSVESTCRHIKAMQAQNIEMKGYPGFRFVNFQYEEQTHDYMHLLIRKSTSSKKKQGRIYQVTDK